MRQLLAVLTLVPTLAFGDNLPINAKSAIVIDLHHDKILYEKNSTDERAIASLTKIMTAMVILDAQLPLDEEITITQEDVNSTYYKGRNLRGYLQKGMKFTRGELLHLSLMSSLNRAAYALARTYPGGRDAFIDAMNEKAKQLEMFDTKFVDPTGLYNENRSTAYDVALLVKAGYAYSEIRELSTSAEYNETKVYKKKKRKVIFGTTNRLVVRDEWQVELQKTGYIRDAGRCVAMVARIDDKPIVIILLGATSERSRALDAVKIKYWIEHHHIPPKSVLRKLDPYRS